jgi:hypothetical protein
MKNKNITIKKIMAGTDFNSAAKELQKSLKFNDEVIEFDFNGILCRINQNTDLNLLYRDYMNAHTMNWKRVGTLCKPYSDRLKNEIKKRNDVQYVNEKARQKEYDKKCKLEKEKYFEKTKGIEIELIDKDLWNKTKENNSKDSYSNCVIQYAEGWAKLMQLEMMKGKTLSECAKNTSFEMGFLGITVNMYGCAVNILIQIWKYGNELKNWHNLKYNYEGVGVVNPAVFTIKGEL